MQSETIRATGRSASRSDASCTDEGGNQHAIRDHQGPEHGLMREAISMQSETIRATGSVTGSSFSAFW